MIFKTENELFLQLEKLDFSLSTWLDHWYPAICDFLNIHPQCDLKAVRDIDNLFKPNLRVEKLVNELKGKIAIIIAPGNSLSKEIADKIREVKSKNVINTVLISVDGATTFLLEQKLIPEVIISDLDGCVEDQIKAQRLGSTIIVHIHGDNFEKAKKYLPKMIQAGKVIFSTQTEELGNFRNFLGFTDGDRAVCFAANSEVKEIILFGYDFGEKIGKYSKVNTLTKEKIRKKFQKFTIAKSIINWCSKGIKIINS